MYDEKDFEKDIENLKKWSEAYYKGESLVSDPFYDKVYRRYEKYAKEKNLELIFFHGHYE